MKCIIRALLPFCLAYAPWSAAQPLDVEAVASRNMATVLVIQGKRADTGAEVQGSGCCIHPDGYVLATAHQAEGVKDFVGRLADGTKVALELVESRPDVEFALFKATSPLPAHAMLGDGDTLKSGAPLVSIAAPMNLEFSTVSGTVANPHRTFDGYAVIQVALTATHGSSGGPVFDRDGRLIGLISGGFNDIDFTIVNKINNAFPLLEAHGVQKSTMDAAELSEARLVPAAGVSESELRAIEAYNRGVAASDIEEKIEAYHLAATLLPAFYEANFNLAVAEASMGATAKAIESYQKAAALRPDGIEVKRNLGRLYLREKAYDKAVAVFDEARQLAPDDAQSYNDLGEACRRAERNDEAIAHFTESLRLKDSAPTVHYNLALALASVGKSDDAIKHFETYLSISPTANDAEDVRAWIKKLKTP
jgi:Flp pilus assembly protein TadD